MNRKLLAALHKVIALSDRDEEIFGQGGCWELAEVLSQKGLHFAVIKEETEYLGEKDVIYPHAFAVDKALGNKAVDVYGRVSLDNMLAKWQKLLSGKVSIEIGYPARYAAEKIQHIPSLLKEARKLVEDNVSFFFGGKK